MPRRRRDDAFEQRLEMEIIVDAKPEEQSIGWYHYLEVCEHEMFVNIGWQERLLAVPLIQLVGVAVDGETTQAIQDWHKWVERGHLL